MGVVERQPHGDRPFVSVVVPAYNATAFIADALRSIMGQTYTHFEVILVNDGTPDTPDLERAIAPFLDRIVYVVQENRGLSGARNTGIKKANGDYVAFLDADDIWLPDYLEIQVGRASRDPAADILYGNAEIFGDVPEAGRYFAELSPSVGNVDFVSLVNERCTVMVSAMVRRSLFDRIGFFDEELRSAEDFDLWLRAAWAGARFSYTARVLCRYRRRGGSLSADPIWMYSHKIAVLNKCLRTMELPPAQRRLVTDRVEFLGVQRRFCEGRRAFFNRDYVTARAALTDANTVLRSVKIASVLLALRFFPSLLTATYNARDRLLYGGKRTKY